MARHCRHILSNGNQCASFPLTGTNLCYQHFRICKRRRRTLTAPPEEPKATSSLVPELLGPNPDRQSFQTALSQVFNEIAAGRLRCKQASRAISCLHLISINQRNRWA